MNAIVRFNGNKLNFEMLCAFCVLMDFSASAEEDVYCVCGWVAPREAANGEDVVHCLSIKAEIGPLSGYRTDCGLHCSSNFGPNQVAIWYGDNTGDVNQDRAQKLQARCHEWATTNHPGLTISEKKLLNE